jgi:hypothetical protein
LTLSRSIRPWETKLISGNKKICQCIDTTIQSKSAGWIDGEGHHGPIGLTNSGLFFPDLDEEKPDPSSTTGH